MQLCAVRALSQPYYRSCQSAESIGLRKMANGGGDDRLGRGFGSRRSKLVRCFDIALLKSQQLQQTQGRGNTRIGTMSRNQLPAHSR